MFAEISDKIRSLRKSKELTLKDLSQKTGLSVGFLSQVENGTSSLAITSLKKIADAMDVPMNYFFNAPETRNFLVRAEDEKPFKIEGSDSEFIRLSGDFPSRQMEAIVSIIPPEHQHGTKFSHPGEEFLYVLEGALIVNIDGTEYVVNAGDSMHYPCNVNHVWINPLKQKTKVLSILTPVIF